MTQRIKTLFLATTIILIVGQLLLFNSVAAQNTEKEKETPDVLPEFYGGMEKFYEYLEKELRYPEEARLKGISGAVVVEFIVEENGEVDSVKVVRFIQPDKEEDVQVTKLFDDEVVRVMLKSPKWKPATKDGKPVRCYFELPIRFTFE